MAKKEKKKKNQSGNNKTKIQSLRFVTAVKLFVLHISALLSTKQEAYPFIFNRYLLRSYPVQGYIKMYTYIYIRMYI